MPSSPDISIVIPTFNEIGNLVAVIDTVAKALEGEAWEIVFVDDDSPDGTAARAKDLGRTDPRIRCLHRVNRRGLAGACIEGMLSSSAPYLVVMDADLQHDATILPKLVAALRSGRADVAIGSRYVGEGTAAGGFSEQRAAASRFATRLARLAFKTDVEDLMSGYFAIRRDRFDAAAPRLATAGFKILADILASSPTPLRAVEIGYRFGQRQAGESKLDLRVTIDFAGFLVNKITGNLLPSRFVAFALVGTIGALIHLAVLRASMLTMPESRFAASQAIATFVAMTSNFFVNNAMTYRDRQVRGLTATSRALLTFWTLCALGAIVSVAVAAWLFGAVPIWWFAGLSGLLAGAVVNYAVHALLVWPERG